MSGTGANDPARRQAAAGSPKLTAQAAAGSPTRTASRKREDRRLPGGWVGGGGLELVSESGTNRARRAACRQGRRPACGWAVEQQARASRAARPSPASRSPRDLPPRPASRPAAPARRFRARVRRAGPHAPRRGPGPATPAAWSARDGLAPAWRGRGAPHGEYAAHAAVLLRLQRLHQRALSPRGGGAGQQSPQSESRRRRRSPEPLSGAASTPARRPS